jgi:hypothetical protein
MSYAQNYSRLKLNLVLGGREGCLSYKGVGKFNLVSDGLLVVLNRCAAEQYCSGNFANDAQDFEQEKACRHIKLNTYTKSVKHFIRLSFLDTLYFENASFFCCAKIIRVIKLARVSNKWFLLQANIKDNLTLLSSTAFMQNIPPPGHTLTEI